MFRFIYWRPLEFDYECEFLVRPNVVLTGARKIAVGSNIVTVHCRFTTGFAKIS